MAEPEGEKGIYSALNYGFKKYGKEYQYLTFINDDDYWLPDYSHVIQAVKDDGSLELVYGRIQYVNENNIMIGIQACYPKFESFVPLFMSNVIMLTQQATLIKSSLYFQIGGFDSTYKLVADTKFWIQASCRNVKYKYVNCICAAYMIQQGQLSSDHQTQNEEHRRIINELGLNNDNRIISLIAYRLYNTPLYMKRLCRFKGHIMKPYLGGQF